MSGQRMSPHWWPEGWRLFAAALPRLFRGRRRMIVVVVAAAGAIFGAALTRVVGERIFASMFFSLLIAGLAVSTCLLVFRRGDVRVQWSDAYISDAQEKDMRAARRRGDFTGIPRNVRDAASDAAERARVALPAVLLPQLWGRAIFLPVAVVVLVNGDPIFPVALIVLGILVVVGSFTIGAELYLLGSTTATLDAEARAVAREAEESRR